MLHINHVESGEDILNSGSHLNLAEDLQESANNLMDQTKG